MKSIEILKKEHENILKIADAIEKECKIIESGKEINKNFFEKVIWFIKNYADKFHHSKEEDILFKEMLKDSTQECLHCNPIDQMLYEHNLGRNFIRELEKGLKAKNKEKIIKNAKAYSHLIREHIFKEDNILYPMTESIFNNKTKKSILKKFEKINKIKEKDKKRGLSILSKIENEK